MEVIVLVPKGRTTADEHFEFLDCSGLAVARSADKSVLVRCLTGWEMRRTPRGGKGQREVGRGRLWDEHAFSPIGSLSAY